jgi:hypothetical protein
VTIARFRLGTRLAGAGLLLALFACGEDTTPTAAPTPAPSTPSPSPTAPAPSVLIQGEEALAAPTGKGGRVLKWDFTLPVAGTVEATVAYKYDSSRVLVWVTDRVCNPWQFQRDECFYLAKSVEGARPRVVSATGVKTGTYTLFVSNDGPFDEEIGYKVTLLPDSSGEGRLPTGLSGSSARQ